MMAKGKNTHTHTHKDWCRHLVADVLAELVVLTDQKLPSPPHMRFLQELEVACVGNHYLACNLELRETKQWQNMFIIYPIYYVYHVHNVLMAQVKYIQMSLRFFWWSLNVFKWYNLTIYLHINITQVINRWSLQPADVCTGLRFEPPKPNLH